MKHVSVDIVTGFLGSGKTTLISHLLSTGAEGERIAVVMNEIGDVGIDGRTITGLEYLENVVELNSGCICCTIDDVRFDLAMQELVETVRPTLIVVESTGLADPDPMVYRLKQSGLALDAVICVVDAVNAAAYLRSTEVAAAQIRAADFLVLNKTDLASPRQITGVRRRLARLNRRAMVEEVERGRVATDLLVGTAVRRYRSLQRGPRTPRSVSDHMRRDAIASFTYVTRAELDLARFERLLARLPRSIYRAKGLLRLRDNDWSCLFNFTCGRYELNWIKLYDRAADSQAVFIGRDLDRLEARIRRALAGCEVG